MRQRDNRGCIVKGHIDRGAFYVLLLLAVCVIPFALGQWTQRPSEDKFAGPITPCSPSIWVMGGGRTPPNPSNEVDSFCPGGPPPEWRLGPPFVTARRNFATDTDVGNPAFGTAHIWLAGGYAKDGITPLSSMEIYCHVVPTPTEPPPPPVRFSPTPRPRPSPAPRP
jgi:hypothetical protein